jgi:hypothetical protein
MIQPFFRELVEGRPRVDARRVLNGFFWGAAALERELAGDRRTARPIPDIAALSRAAKLCDSPGFLGFD